MLAAINTATLGGKRDMALFLTLAWTCRRASEVLEMKWGDLYPDLGGKHVYRYYSRSQQEPQWVELDSRVYEAICTYLAANGRLKTIQPEDYIFVPLYPERAARLHRDITTDPDRPLSPRTAASVLKKYARKIGLDPECAHLRGLRHAGALLRYKLMKEQGAVDYVELKKVLDHGSLGVTMTYVQEVLEGSAASDGLLAAWQSLTKGKERR
jgi:integrase